MPDLSGAPIEIAKPGGVGTYSRIGETTGGDSTIAVDVHFSGGDAPSTVYLFRAWDGAALGTIAMDKLSSPLHASEEGFAALQTSDKVAWTVQTWDPDGKPLARTPLVGDRSPFPEIRAAPGGGAYVLTHEFGPAGVSLVFYRFDAAGHVVAGPTELERQSFGANGQPQAFLWIAPSGHVLAGFNTPSNGDIAGMWLDENGRPLSARFTVVTNLNIWTSWWDKLSDVAGGVLIPPYHGTTYFPDLATAPGDVPKVFADKPWVYTWNFAALPRARGYVTPTTTPYFQVSAPAGNLCGGFAPPGSSPVQLFAIARDGTFIVTDQFKLRWWPRAFR